MIQLIYNNLYSYDDFRIIVKTVNRPLLPTKRKNEVTIPGRNGTYDFSDDTYENVVIPVLVQYIDETFEDSRTRARAIAAWLSQASYSPLVFTDEPDKYYLAKIYDAASLDAIVDLVPGGKATVNFECHPMAYSIDANLWKERVIEEQTFVYEGTYKVKPIITITPVVLLGGMDESVELTGAFPNTPINLELPEEWPPPLVTTLSTPSITINGKTLVYADTITEGQTLTINTDTYQATKGGVNVLGKISGDWPVLEVGNNTVLIEDTTSELGASIVIGYRKRWI